MTRLIKKYPNRRLYDTAISKYITLEEIKELVARHIQFKVADAKTEEDVTNQVLLQVINEQEAKQSSAILTAEILRNIIRFYDSPLQHAVSQYLEKGLGLFATQQTNFQRQIHNFMQTSPVNLMTDLTNKQLALWKSTFEQLFMPTSSLREATDKKQTSPTRSQKKPATKK